MQSECMNMQPEMYGHAVHTAQNSPKRGPSMGDLGKPLQYKAFRVFPVEVTDTPTKAMDLYSERCITMQSAMYENTKK